MRSKGMKQSPKRINFNELSREKERNKKIKERREAAREARHAAFYKKHRYCLEGGNGEEIRRKNIHTFFDFPEDS